MRELSDTNKVFLFIWLVLMSVGIGLMVYASIVEDEIQQEATKVKNRYIDEPCYWSYSNVVTLSDNITYTLETLNNHTTCSYDPEDFNNTISRFPIRDRVFYWIARSQLGGKDGHGYYLVGAATTALTVLLGLNMPL